MEEPFIVVEVEYSPSTKEVATCFLDLAEEAHAEHSSCTVTQVVLEDIMDYYIDGAVQEDRYLEFIEAVD